MLNKEIKEKLIKKSWNELRKDHSNPYQAWHRIRTLSINAINDLILLANKLPDDEQAQIFSNPNIENFISAILSKTHNNEPNLSSIIQNIKDTSTDSDDEYRRLQLCVMLLNNCFDYFIKEINKKEEFKILSAIVEPAISQLQQSKSICIGIKNTIELSNIKKEEGKRNSKYLFNLDNIDFSNPNKFQFLYDTKEFRSHYPFYYYYWVSDIKINNDQTLVCELDISPRASEYLERYENNILKSKSNMLSSVDSKITYENIKNMKPIFVKLLTNDAKSMIVEYRNSSDKLNKKNFEIQLDIAKINGSRYVFGKKSYFES